MIQIGVLGCMGRMGKALVKEVVAHEACVLAGGTAKKDSPFLGKDMGEEAGLRPLGIRIQGDVFGLFEASDVLIDFTRPEATVEHLKGGSHLKKPLVIGTTGLNDLHFQLIQEAAQQIPILLDSNMSLGITLLKTLTREAARILGKSFDIDILEMHHRHKLDAPSGTAYALGQAAAEGRNLPFEKVVQLNRTQNPSARQENEIGFAVMRGGNVVGDHTVVFASESEVLTLGHRALTESVFAQGALKGALWLLNQKPGLYSMKDVLGL